MELYQFILLVGLLFLVEVIYLRLARQFQIVDVPNHRSSHQMVTLNGGGIVLAIAGMGGVLHLPGNDSWWMMAALLLVSAVSITDDLKGIPPIGRIVVQLVAVSFIAFQYPLFWAIAIAIVGVGFLNAYNFMDGINGLNVLYSLVVCGSLYVLLPDFRVYILFLVAGLMVLGWFNCRPQGRAICFSGDIGSITVGLLIMVPLLHLMWESISLSYVLLVAVYGIDSVGTILIRLIQRQNIFQAHRMHLYQIMVNEKGIPHLTVSLGYAVVQLAISGFNISNNFAFQWGWQLLILALLYTLIRFVILKNRLIR